VWNVILVQNYYKMLAIKEKISLPHIADHLEFDPPPWASAVFGTLGFVMVLATLIFFFVKLLKEMKYNQMHREFLAKISHELRSPLSTIELSSGLLKNPTLDPADRQKLWNSHDSELKRLKVEVDMLIKASRLEMSALQAEPQDVNLEQWLQESLDKWQAILGPSAEISRHGSPLPKSLALDPKLLDLAVNNIVDNVRKFAVGTPKLSLKTEDLEGRWKITFQDAGLGFSEEDAKRIFYRFYRAKHQAEHAIPGSGLGLYFAKSACDAMKIKISAQSAGTGKGSFFSLEGPTR